MNRDERDRDYGRGRDSSRDRDDPRDRDRGYGRDSSGSRDRDDRGSSRSGGRYEYRKRDADETRKRAESKGGDFDVYINRDIDTFKPNDKVNTIRILPPTWDDAKHYGLDVWVHYGIGADRQAYLCLHKMKGEQCPICEERAVATRKGDEDYAKELAPTRRVLVYVVDRDHEKDGVQAWAMPQSLDRDITKVSIDRRSGDVLPIDHPDEGYDIIFEREGQSTKTKYLGVQVDRRDSRLGDDRWLEFAQENPLPNQLVYYSYDHIKSAFTGGGGGGSRDSRDERGRDERDRDDRRDDRRDSRDDRGSRDERDRSARDDRGGRSGGDRIDWESVHQMRPRELEALIEQERLKINPKEAKDDADLADWICEEMGLRAPAKPDARDDRGGGRGDDRGGDVNSRLEEMRSRRRD